MQSKSAEVHGIRPSKAPLAVFLVLLVLCVWKAFTSPALPPPPVASASASPSQYIQLVPGEAAGQISIGMSLALCEQILGPADLSQDLEDGRVITWDAMQVSVQMAKGGHPSRPSDQDNNIDMVSNILVRSEHYATASHIKVGSTLAEVEKAYGPTENRNGLLSYPNLGINFLVEGDKVVEVIIFPKSSDSG